MRPDPRHAEHGRLMEIPILIAFVGIAIAVLIPNLARHPRLIRPLALTGAAVGIAVAGKVVIGASLSKRRLRERLDALATGHIEESELQALRYSISNIPDGLDALVLARPGIATLVAERGHFRDTLFEALAFALHGAARDALRTAVHERAPTFDEQHFVRIAGLFLEHGQEQPHAPEILAGLLARSSKDTRDSLLHRILAYGDPSKKAEAWAQRWRPVVRPYAAELEPWRLSYGPEIRALTQP